jgi:hypothetical protein
MVMDSHEIKTKLRNAAGLFFDMVITGAEYCMRLQISSPESRRHAIGEYKISTACRDKTMSSGRAVIFVEKGQIHR